MFKEKPGDDTGMQTRVWGPAGWLFLHSIAQNYPWKPTDEQKNNYLSFFKLVGNVLPCRYCRESFQKYVTGVDNWKPSNIELENPDLLTKEDYKLLILDKSKLKSRETLVKWLYDIHNRINKKLGVECDPTFKEVWNKYESFRSNCVKSKKIIKKGCLDPMKGLRKKCNIEIINVDKNGNAFGKKKNIGGINLISIKKSNRSGKKLMATFKIDGRSRVIHFGAAGMSDFTKHNDIKRRNRYIFRHKKDLKTNDPTRAGYLSMYVLWNKRTIKASITDYKRRLAIFNKTGKFPTKISGYN